MSNNVIIDAWNVCWKIPELAQHIPADLEKVRTRFNQMVAGYFAGKKITYKIVYDGQAMIFPQTDVHEKKVYFSRNPEKADELIIKFVKKQRSKKNWTVVTSDNRLSLEVRDLGAKSISSEDFILNLTRKKSSASKENRKSNPGIDSEDIAYWLDKFSDKEGGPK